MGKKKQYLILLGTFLILLAIIGVTYAYWTISLTQEEKNEITTSCFEVSLENENDPILLRKAKPITDEEAKELVPYTFTIHNKCDAAASYQINLEILEDTTLDEQYLKYILNEEGIEGNGLSFKNQVDPTLVKETDIKKATKAYELETGYLNPSEKKSYELRLYLDGGLTIESQEVMNKVFDSKITVISSYLTDEKIPPIADVELAVCGNTITATGSGTLKGNKEITKYEYKMDDGEWEEGDSTKVYENVSNGIHKVSIKITDSKNLVSEDYTSEVTINNPLKEIGGKQIPIVNCGNGLYEVIHNEEDTAEMDTGWQTTEYRYAGKNPANYVTFNEEKWRIIGLVNVKTNTGIEQRMKLIRDGKIGNYSWDTSKEEDNGGNGTNNWTESDIMKLLNEGYSQNQLENSETYVNNSLYWDSTNGFCYNAKNNATTPCEFQNIGIKTTTQSMIEQPLWNIGGSDVHFTVTTPQFYQKERGIMTPSNSPSEWLGKIGLIYPSDYGYATSGGTLGREECFKKELYNWKNNEYSKECGANDWLKPSSEWQWTMTTYTNYPFISYIAPGGYVNDNGYNPADAIEIVPTLYLKANVQIKDNKKDGSYENPYDLEFMG